MNKSKLAYKGLMIFGLGWLIYIFVNVQLILTFWNIKTLSLIILFSFILGWHIVGVYKEITFKNRKKDGKSSKFSAWILGVSFLSLGVFIMYAITIRNKNELEALKNQDYRQINSIIINHPETRNARYHFVKIKIKQYSDFNFKFKSLSIPKTNRRKFNSKVVKGDSICIVISLSDYRKKLEKLEPLSFLDKHNDYKDINIYDLSIGNVRYIDKEKVIKSKEDSKYDFGLLYFFRYCLLFWVC